RQFAILDDQPGQFILCSQLFEHIHGGRYAARFCLAAHAEVELLEYVSQLVSGVDVKLTAGLRVDLSSEPLEFLLHLATRPIESDGVDSHSDALHLEQYLDQRQFDLPVKRIEAGLL